MHPYYFGNSSRQLYGVYDSPLAHGNNDTGILQCYPVGQEYMRSHWAHRQLAGHLCRAGMHCMRFDYYGTGDSAGLSAEADLNQWHCDVNTGLEELRDVSGVSKISIVGLRFGAVLAATAPESSSKPRKLVMWDPVVSGADYVDRLRSMHQSLMERLNAIHNNRSQHDQAGIEELVGFRFSEKMFADIEAVNLLELSEYSASDIFLVVSGKNQEYEDLREHLESLGVLKGYRMVSSTADWGNLQKFDSALIASEAVNEIASLLTS